MRHVVKGRTDLRECHWVINTPGKGGFLPKFTVIFFLVDNDLLWQPVKRDKPKGKEEHSNFLFSSES